MALLRLSVTQSGVDTQTDASIDTNLSVDGKTGWSITGMRAIWTNGQSAAAGDQTVMVSLNTEVGGFAETDSENIAVARWMAQNTGGVAVCYPIYPVVDDFLLEARVTVQPNLFVSVDSGATGIAVSAIVIIQYEIVKLSDIEVLRLLAGGA